MYCYSLVFVAMCSVFWSFWLSCHYLPSDWLERLLWGSPTVVGDHLHKAQAEECLWFSWFTYCFIVLLCVCVVSWPYTINFPTAMARYSLFVLKVPLNTKQTNKLAIHESSGTSSCCNCHSGSCFCCCLCFIVFVFLCCLVDCLILWIGYLKKSHVDDFHIFWNIICHFANPAYFGRHIWTLEQGSRWC